MPSLEEISHRIIVRMYRGREADEKEKAQAEFGLSIIMGTGLEILAVILASFLLMGTAFYAFFVMVGFFLLRTYTGGAHCTTYLRCFLVTLFIFVPASFLARFLHFQSLDEPFVLLLLVVLSLLSVILIVGKKRFVATIFALSSAVLLAIVSMFPDFPSLRGIAVSIVLGGFIQAVSQTGQGKAVISFLDSKIK